MFFNISLVTYLTNNFNHFLVIIYFKNICHVENVFFNTTLLNIVKKIDYLILFICIGILKSIIDDSV